MPVPAYSGTIPENYDRYLGPYIFDPFAADVASRLPVDATGSVLEIACGTGRVTAQLRKALTKAEIVATDINPDMLAIARARVDESGKSGIHWQTADAQQLPFDDARFDAVVFQFGLMFVPERLAALCEAYRVLRPGGRLLLSTWDRLENNPSFFLANEVVAGYFPEEPPRFFHLPFSMCDDGLLMALAGDAGFVDVSLTLTTKVCVSESAAGVAVGMLEGTPMYTLIMERDAALLPVIKTSLTEALAREFGDAPLRSPMKAWIMEATK